MRRGGDIREYDWGAAEVSALLSAYSDSAMPVDLASLAMRLGRNKANVSRKARSFGLTNIRRLKVRPEDKKIQIPRFKTRAERSLFQSETTKARIARNGHPRGALGIKHSETAKAIMGAKARANWLDPSYGNNSPTSRQRMSDNMLVKISSGAMNCGYSRARGGKRSDLGGAYFRSAWEANYARYLNFLLKCGEIAGWEFEPETFEFKEIKRGTRAYTPDFRVDRVGGGYEWHEVKGWMDPKSKIRLNRFALYFPNEKLVVVGPEWFRSANKVLSRMIPGWESGSVH